MLQSKSPATKKGTYGRKGEQVYRIGMGFGLDSKACPTYSAFLPTKCQKLGVSGGVFWISTKHENMKKVHLIISLYPMRRGLLLRITSRLALYRLKSASVN